MLKFGSVFRIIFKTKTISKSMLVFYSYECPGQAISTWKFFSVRGIFSGMERLVRLSSFEPVPLAPGLRDCSRFSKGADLHRISSVSNLTPNNRVVAIELSRFGIEEFNPALFQTIRHGLSSNQTYNPT